ncbi:MAG: hypothetical protein GY832_17895 [Chloroflexi bacterium]|nr:hypothetical protein [Chloroflexota bacterium]
MILCFSGGERWGGGEGHHPQTSNHHDKANPSTAITPPRLWPQTTPPTDPSLPLAQGDKPTHHLG